MASPFLSSCSDSVSSSKTPNRQIVARSPSPELAEELEAFSKTRLDHYKSPREIVFLDALPRTHLGKIDRGALARMRQRDASAKSR